MTPREIQKVEDQVYELLVDNGNPTRVHGRICPVILIGNMVYGFTKELRVGYGYVRDVKNPDFDFKPVWDKEKNEEFGWVDPMPIFNLIKEELNKK